jgi:flagellar basal-body rod modification protein FlgD
MSNISGLGSNAKELTTNYLNLLITQLQNQNPLDPMDNSQMASQLAQLAQLQQSENMSSTFDKVLQSTQVSAANSLIGKTVTWLPDNAEETVSGAVTGVDLSGDTVQLKIGSQSVDADLILGIQN